MSVLTASSVRRRRRLPRLGLPLLILVVLAAAASAALGTRALLHREEALPGVHVLGVDLAGLREGRAGLRIREATAARLAEPVPLEVRGRELSVTPNRLFMLDRAATAAAALEAGRDSWTSRARSLLSPLTSPQEIEPVLRVRPAAEERLGDLLHRFGRPAVSAGVAMDGTQPVVNPSTAGTQPDLSALLAAIGTRVATGAGVVAVAFEPAPPVVSDAAAREAADEARLMVSAPVALSVEGEPIGSLTPERLAGLLRFREADGRLLVLLDEERLARTLDPAVGPFKERAVNARFAVDGQRASVVPAKDGRGLDAAQALVAITTAAHARADRSAGLAMTSLPADLTTAEATGLGIRERISSFTTEMGVSSSNRIHNVHLMADYIDGTVVRPGESFSFNDSVGPRSPERGFLEGQMIVGSLLLPSIGGGVCQTATTLFNNAFELGLPITQRYNHSFYISHYPLGRDATVSWGGPDFGFRNDMKSAVLIKSSYTDSTLTFSFYGTSEGRTVTASTGPKVNWREPKLTYALDPQAPRGSVRRVSGSNQPGFDVTVTRTVTRAGKVLREDAFTSSYIAVGPTEIYGPGRTIPGSYFVIPVT